MSDQTTHNDKPKKSPRINGLVFFGILFLIIMAITYRPAIETIACNETTLNPKPDVIMLGAWWCPYCSQARKYLQYNNISYCEYDMERTEEGKRLYEEVNGQAIPILLIGKYQLNGYDEGSIQRALEILHSQ